MTRALIAFGANIGDVHASFRQSVKQLSAVAEVALISAASPVVTTAVTGKQIHDDPDADPDPDADAETDADPDYLNSAVLVETSLSVEQLLVVTQAIERDMGRQRPGSQQRWRPRKIDLDIILFGQQIVDRPGLQIPHPRMSFRKFVLGPAIEIAADMIDPISQVPLKTLWDRIDQGRKNVLWIADDLHGAQSIAASLPRRGDRSLEIAGDLRQAKAALESYGLMMFSGALAVTRQADGAGDDSAGDDSGNGDSVDPSSDRFHPERVGSHGVDFLAAARRFAGPWLNLTGAVNVADPDRSSDSSSSIQSEIVGAFEAIEAL